MKVTVEFDLPEETEELFRHLHGPAAHAVLWDVDQHLRMTIKHGEHAPGVADALQSLRDYLHEAAAAQEITID